MLSDFVTSVVRTVVPSAVGTVLAWLVAAGVDLDPATTGVDVNPATSAALSGALVTVCIGGYYAVARAAETRWPAAGWLLGIPKAPSYRAAPSGDDDLDAAEDDDVISLRDLRDAPTEWLAQAGTAPGDVVPEAPEVAP